MLHTVKNKANKLLELAIELSNQGKMEEAIGAYRKLLEIAPDWAVPWYNLGLIYKHRQEWALSLKHNLRAAKLDPGDQPSWWNAGIAATALKDWKKARMAWRGFGIPIPSGDEDSEIKMKIGNTPMRLCENREVVWVERIDPARAVIINVPTEPSKRRYKDLILNDGAPNGQRIYGGNPYPVFDEIELVQASDYHTFSVWVQTQSKIALERLEQLCDRHEAGFENWTNTLRHVCKQCSEGTPHEHHDKSQDSPPADGIYQLGIAVKSEPELKKMLDAWEKATQAKVIEFECVL